MTDWTGTLNDLAIGPGTPFQIASLDGWLDATGAAYGGASIGSGTQPAPRGVSNGSWQAPYFMPERMINLGLSVTAPAPRSGAGAYVNASSTVLSCSSAAFTAADVGSTVTVRGAGGAGADLVTTIASVSTATLAYMSDPAFATVGPTDWILTPSAHGLGQTVKALRLATQPGAVTLTVTLDGVTASAVGQLTSRTIPTAVEYQMGLTDATVSIECADPLLYGSPFYSSAWTSAGGGTELSTFVSNAGTAPMPLVLTIAGPVTGTMNTLSIEAADGSVLAFSGLGMTSSSTLTVDLGNRTALINGTSVANKITQRGWFATGPGSLNLSIVSDVAISPSQASVSTYTGAWL